MFLATFSSPIKLVFFYCLWCVKINQENRGLDFASACKYLFDDLQGDHLQQCLFVEKVQNLLKRKKEKNWFSEPF